MKKLLMIVMLICSANMFSLDHGLITGFEAGFNSKNIDEIGDIRVSLKDEFSLKTIGGIRLYGFRIIGSYEKTFKSYGLSYNIPILDIYGLNISLTISNVTLGCNLESLHIEDSLLENYYSGRNPQLYIKYYKEF